MRQDGYSLELRTPAGLRLPEIQHQGVTYVVGRPGQAYVVHAAAPLLTMNKPASKQLQAACDVDGRSTGLWLTLTLHHSTKAWTGFYLGNYRDIHKEQPFLFSEPHRFDVPGTSAAAADAGTVRVVFSIRGPFIGQSQRNGRGADPAPAVKKTEGTKVWKLPSLTTEAGPVRPAREATNDLYKQGPIMAELCVRLETATTLALRGILQASNRAHQGLLAQDAARRPAQPARLALPALPPVAGVKRRAVSVQPAGRGHPGGARRMGGPAIDLTDDVTDLT